jgi:thiamine-phosphate pyrophosphorylase
VAREILGQDKIIGWSIDHPDQIMTEEANLADYLAIGPIFFTATKNDISEPWGIDGLKLARSMTNKPLVAIGGISEQNIFDVVAAGADSVAVVSAIVSADDVENATRNLTQIIRKSKLDHSRKSH